MKRLLHALCSATLLAAATLAHADIDRPAAESLVRKSGLWEQLAGVGPQVEAGIQQSLAQGGMAPGESEKARLTQVIRMAYAPERLRAVSTGVIAARMRPQHLNALRQWFDSPQGQAVTRVEEEAGSAQGDPNLAMKEGVALLKSMPADRRKLLEDLLAATHAADALVQITIGTAVAAQVGVASTMPNGGAPSPAEVRGMLEAQRPEMLKAFGAMMLASFAHTYAKIPSPQLRQYVAFIRTPAGTHFNAAAMEAMAAALTDAAAEMGRRLPGTRDGRNT
ncbi:MAG TPA: hypothetical protein VF522_12440 [Ramlibacter sp.]|uniref:hypothetical protein n=1 Tax=Ramlibacter sp. TaxID=1917967 RepID=UPI002ED6A549